MNNIIFPMKVHAVKLEYRRLKLENMVHGYFKERNGKSYIIVNHDPNAPKINCRHQRRIRVTTKRGQELADKINEYQKLHAEYISLLNDWKRRYSFAPPKVNFPIIQYSDPHCMNNDYFNKQVERLGKYKAENPTVSEHGELKSKNELMGADLLKDMGMPFKYETELYLREIDETINPDYLVNFYEIDRCAYLEILGMTDKIDYFYRSANKIYGFSKEMFRPGREVIYVFVYDKANFDKDYFVSQVLTAFNDMIPDSALIWETDIKAA